MIMGIVVAPPPAAAVALDGSVMNCGMVVLAPAPATSAVEGAARMGNLVAVVEMIWGASTVPPVGRDVGMYVMGNTVGQDWVPAAAISWILAAAAFCVVKIVFPSPVPIITAAVELAGVTWVVAVAAATAAVGEAVTGTVETGMAIMSGVCWTGDVAVWALFCFSSLRHFARRFWNHTYGSEDARWKDGGL